MMFLARLCILALLFLNLHCHSLCNGHIPQRPEPNGVVVPVKRVVATLVLLKVGEITGRAVTYQLEIYLYPATESQSQLGVIAGEAAGWLFVLYLILKLSRYLSSIRGENYSATIGQVADVRIADFSYIS